jgi:type I restriction enzyme R subunit
LQRHYEEIVEAYNREKDRVTIENTFAALLKFVQALDDEESRAMREGLDEESLALFDLLLKPGLEKPDIQRIKKVAAELLTTLKTEKLRIENWREKEATRDAVQVTIENFLWEDNTGLPAPAYSEEDVKTKARDVYRHVYRVYPTIPSPFYTS